jgi:hypothetical protein
MGAWRLLGRVSGWPVAHWAERCIRQIAGARTLLVAWRVLD